MDSANPLPIRECCLFSSADTWAYNRIPPPFYRRTQKNTSSFSCKLLVHFISIKRVTLILEECFLSEFNEYFMSLTCQAVKNMMTNKTGKTPTTIINEETSYNT